MAHFTKQHVTIVNLLCSSVLKRQKEAGNGPFERQQQQHQR